MAIQSHIKVIICLYHSTVCNVFYLGGAFLSKAVDRAVFGFVCSYPQYAICFYTGIPLTSSHHLTRVYACFIPAMTAV